MISKEKLYISIFVILLLLISFINAFEDQSNFKINKRDNSSMQNSSEVRVFIKYREINVGKGLFLKKNISSQEDLVNRIGKERVKHRFNGTISAKINKEDIEKIRLDKNVEEVTLVKKKQLMLQDSVPLINSSFTQRLQINGINLTGKGQTVCIIDTGVNFSNPSLGGCYGNNNATSSCKVIGGYDTAYEGDDPILNIMDYEGHGTHVAGIVAANGTINGVAPESKIIAISAYDYNEGSFWDDDLIEGINWCVNNASIFNISVISMSLGADLYTNYCNSDPLASAINSAVAKNISVVIAAGNGLNNVGPGRYDSISTPACIESAIPVSATTKSDNIDQNYADRNFMVQLLAPGTSINSTYLSSSGYGSLSGTSMATPHVAGAIAIINQYLAMTGRTRTPSQVESILNSTGKIIVDDGYSGLSFSRINIYQAILSLDNSYPTYSNNSTSGTYKKFNNFTININLSDNFLISNAWIESNHSGNMTNYSYFINLKDHNLSKSYNISLSRGKTLAFRIYLNDSAGNTNVTPWSSIVIQNSAPTNLIFPNQSWAINSNLSINLSQYFSDLDNDELNYSNLSSMQNISIIINQTTKIATFIPDSNFNGTSYIIFSANDSIDYVNNDNITLQVFIPSFNFTNFSGSTTNFSNLTSFIQIPIIIEKENMGIINFSSADLNQSNLNLDNNVNISFNRIEINSSALPGLNKNANLTMYNISWTTPQILKDGDVCGDCQLISYNSSSQTLIFSVNGFSVYTTRETPTQTYVPSGGGGGGSKSTVQTYTLTANQISSGYTQSLAKGDKIIFNLINKEHTLTINKIATNSTDLGIQSEVINLTMFVGQEKNISVNLNGYYDFYIKLNSIINNKVNITLKSLINPPQIKPIEQNETIENKSDQNMDVSEKKSKDYIILIASIIILILIVAYLMMQRELIDKPTRKIRKVERSVGIK